MSSTKKASDPVADKSSFLCMYMSNHPDTLVAYVKYWGKVKEAVVSARMTSIDSKGMTLAYKVQSDGDAKKEVRITFDPPLRGYEEVKPRLLSMTADAQESLGMTKVPRITGFVFPTYVVPVLLPILLLVYITIAPTMIGPLYEPGQQLFNLVGPKTVQRSWIILIVAHSLESMYMLRLLITHKVDFLSAVKYMLGTMSIGFPYIRNLRQRIQKARIDSIMKGN